MINLKISKTNFENLAFLEPKDELHPDFWQDKTLNPEISEVLKKIIEDIVSSMDITATIKDIIITGSIASYNWHSLSDIDLHVLLDFEEINEDYEIVKKMLDQSRINWNKTHDIMIKGHEVELYFQDASESHQSAGIWSITTESWIVEPEPEDVDLDLRAAEKKAEAIVRSINHAEELLGQGDLPSAHEYSSKIKRKISRMRSAGLSREGIYSPENLAFKMLRNAKYLEKLSNLKITSYDKMMSLSEASVEDFFREKSEEDYMEYGDGGGIDSLLDPKQEAPWGEIEELLERCQKGYKTHPKRKTKKMFGRTYRNCVKAEEGNDPVKGTGKKPKGSGRRLYTDEDPSDTVSVKFSSVSDIQSTLSKASFKSKSHKRQSQIINLIHQRVRAAYNNAKDPKVKARLKKAFDYAKKRKEASKKKTQRMRKKSDGTK
jgi:predicted nucleotidyltransferase